MRYQLRRKMPTSFEPKSVAVGFFLSSLKRGGSQRSTLLTVKHWPRDGSSAHLIVAEASGEHLEEAAEELPIQVVGRVRYLTLPAFVYRLRRTRRELGLNAIVVLTRIAFIALVARKAGWVKNAAIVVVQRTTLSQSVRDNHQNPAARWIVLRLMKLVIPWADAIVGVSHGVSRDLEHTLGLPAGSVRTIYNPVDPKIITQAIDSPIPEELERAFAELPRPVVLTAGRLVTAKAHDDLLHAFAQLPIDQRGSLVILGEGRLREKLQKLAEQLGICDRVWMPGFVDNPWWFINRADVFALSSHNEGHPRVLLEALACGIPIASTDCPSGPREILADARGTRLALVGDTQALSAAISALLADGNTRPSVDLSPYCAERVAKAYAEVVAGVCPDFVDRLVGG